jgi:hypothetical protein
MKLLNIIDNAQRFNGFKIDLTRDGSAKADNEQVNSHTISYLYARDQLKACGEVMGFDDALMFEAYNKRHNPIAYNARLTDPLRLDDKKPSHLMDKSYVPMPKDYFIWLEHTRFNRGPRE